MTLSVNSVPNDPSLSDLLDLLKKEIFLGLNSHHIGTIQSFNSTAQTVVATINYTKTFFQFNSVTQTYVPVQVNYPTLVDCPLVILGGGAAHVTFPVANGDECLLIFNDRDMDNWFQTGQFGPVATGRLHSFSDAIALVGIKSTPNALTSYDAVRAVLTNGNAKCGINPSNNKITLSNTSYGTLNTLLQNILTQLENLCTACAAITVTGVTPGAGVSGVPANAAAITAISTQLSTYATQLGGLLE